MTYKLFLDDQCNNPDIPFRHPPEGFIPVKSSAEAIELIKSKGKLPEFLSFDHDLGGEDSAMVLIDWMIDNHYDEEIPDYQIHSANPVGALNIHAKMQSWLKSKSIFDMART